MASDRTAERYWITGGEEDKHEHEQHRIITIGDPDTYPSNYSRIGNCPSHSTDHKEIGGLDNVTIDGVEYTLDDRWVISACPTCFEYGFSGSWYDADSQMRAIRGHWEEISEPFDRVEEATLDERVDDLEARVARLESAREEA